VKLIAEVLGVLIGGAALTSVGSAPGVIRSAWNRGIGVAVVGIAALLFCDSAWMLIQPMGTATRADAAISKQNAEYPMMAPQVNTAFLAWVQHEMSAVRAPETMWLVPASASNDPLTYQWTTYQLLPAREVAPMKAHWIVFYNVSPSAFPYDRAAFRPPLMFGPTFALAERKP
jgi:hypothetical protein